MAEDNHSIALFGDTSSEIDQHYVQSGDSFTKLFFPPSSSPFLRRPLLSDNTKARQEASLVSTDADTATPLASSQETSFTIPSASAREQDAGDLHLNQSTVVQYTGDPRNVHWTPIVNSDESRGYRHRPWTATRTSEIPSTASTGASSLTESKRRSDEALGIQSRKTSLQASLRQRLQEDKGKGALESFESATKSPPDGHLDDAAQQLCMTWLLCFKGHMPKSEHYEALSCLTGLPAEAFERWFGAKLRSGGSSNNDSGYYSTSHAAQSTIAQSSWPPVTTEQAIGAATDPFGSSGFDDGSFLRPNQELGMDMSQSFVVPSLLPAYEPYFHVDDMRLIPNDLLGINSPKTLLASSYPTNYGLNVDSGNNAANDDNSAIDNSRDREATLARAEDHAQDRLSRSCRPTSNATLLERNPKKPYQCSFKCGKSFARADDLRRHEEAKYPQRGWVCLVERKIVIEGQRRCGYCNEVVSTPDHLEKCHKTCSKDQREGERRFCETYHFRQEHLKQHFERLHPHLRLQDYEWQGRLALTTRFPKYCGFCVRRFETWTWKERIRHLCKHFQADELDMRRWRDESRNAKQDRNKFYGSDPSDSDDSDDDGSDDDGRPKLRHSLKPKSPEGRGPPQGGDSSQQSSGSQQSCGRDSSLQEGDLQTDSMYSITPRHIENQVGNSGVQPPYPSAQTIVKRVLSEGQSVNEWSEPLGRAKKFPYDHYWRRQGAHAFIRKDPLRPSLRTIRARVGSSKLALEDTRTLNSFTSLDFAEATKTISMEHVFCSSRIVSMSPESFSSSVLLGCGGSSVVDKVLHHPTGRVFARKTIWRTKDAEELFENEKRNLERLRHSHLIHLVGSYVQKNSMAIILSPAADMTLSEFMNTPVSPSFQEINHFWEQLGCVADALRLIHEIPSRDNEINDGPRSGLQGCHADIKPANILVFGAHDQATCSFIITDFGSCRFLKSSSKTSTKEGGSDEKLGLQGGTPMYQPPECSVGRSNGSQAADIWSLGCVFLEMITWIQYGNLDQFRQYRRKRFKGNKYYNENIPQAYEWLQTLRARAEEPDIPKIDIVISMLNPDPHKRPSACQIRKFLPPGPCCQSDLDNLKQQAANEELYREAIIQQRPANQNVYRQNSRKALRFLSNRRSSAGLRTSSDDCVSGQLFHDSSMAQCASERSEPREDDQVMDDGDEILR